MIYSSRAALRAVFDGPPKPAAPKTHERGRLFRVRAKKCPEMSGFGPPAARKLPAETSTSIL
jgi:hypothetical protein